MLVTGYWKMSSAVFYVLFLNLTAYYIYGCVYFVKICQALHHDLCTVLIFNKAFKNSKCNEEFGV